MKINALFTKRYTGWMMGPNSINICSDVTDLLLKTNLVSIPVLVSYSDKNPKKKNWHRVDVWRHEFTQSLWATVHNRSENVRVYLHGGLKTPARAMGATFEEGKSFYVKMEIVPPAQ